MEKSPLHHRSECQWSKQKLIASNLHWQRIYMPWIHMDILATKREEVMLINTIGFECFMVLSNFMKIMFRDNDLRKGKHD